MIKTIKFTEEQKRFFEQFVTKLEEAHTAFILAVGLHKTAGKEMWEKLREAFPEIPEGKESYSTFDHAEDEEWSVTYWESTS